MKYESKKASKEVDDLFNRNENSMERSESGEDRDSRHNNKRERLGIV